MFHLSTRSTLEWISLPFFSWLVIDLSGRGLILLFEQLFHHAHDAKQHSHANPLEFFLGVICLGGLYWLWHRSYLSQLVPCRHTGCQHTGNSTLHYLAIAIFVLHFLPESALRYDLLIGNTTIASFTVALGFGLHFLLDVIVTAGLVTTFSAGYKRIIAILSIVTCWILATLTGPYIHIQLEGIAASLLLLGSAFFLAMFVHLPNDKDHAR